MIRGPFPRFEAMMLDARRRAPYVGEAFKVVLAEMAFRLIDEQQHSSPEDVINAMAMQCGMVIDRPDGRTWTYELTEGPL